MPKPRSPCRQLPRRAFLRGDIIAGRYVELAARRHLDDIVYAHEHGLADFFSSSDSTGGSVDAADLPSLTSAIRIEAGDGDDTVDGSDLGDIILAGSGDDLIYGHDGENTLSGEAGDDVMYGGG